MADPESIERLAALLGSAERPVVVAGSGVYWDEAWGALASIAERGGLPVFMNGAGRGCLSTDHPLAFSSARGFALSNADLIIALGAPLDFRLGYGRPPTFAEQAKVVMIDADPTELGRNRDLALGIVANIRLVLRQLFDAIPHGVSALFAGWVREIREKEQKGREALEVHCASDQVPISHFRFAKELAAFVDASTTVVGDGGDVVGCASKVIPLHRPGQWLDPGPFGCLGIGPSFAMAAKLLRSADRLLLISGDGAFSLNGMDLETAVRFNLPMVVAIGNDGGWGQIRNPQLSFFGEARAVGTSLPFTHYERIVEAFGGVGEYVTEPKELRPALERAFASGTLACVNVVLDAAAYRKTGQVSMAI